MTHWCALAVSLLLGGGASRPARAQSVALPNVGPAWHWLDPIPTGFALADLHAFSARRAVAVGAGGTVLRTQDGGVTWQSERSGTTERLTCVHFSDSLRGWAGSTAEQVNVFTRPWPGPGAVRRTTDGGRTWTRQPIGDNRAVRILALQAVSATQGYVLYDALNCRTAPCGGVPEMGLRRTSNGGQSWQSVNSQLPYVDQPDLQFVTPTVGYLAGRFFFRNATLLKTTDGGATWRNVAPDTITSGLQYTQVEFVDPLQGWALGGDSLYATTDGGQTWRARAVRRPSNPTFRYTWARLAAAAPQRLVLTELAGSATAMLLSSDGGQTWQESAVVQGSSGQALRLLPDGGAWFIGDQYTAPFYTAHSTDFGHTWTPFLTRQAPNGIYQKAQVFDVTRLWVVPFADSALLYSADRGEHWRRVPLTTALAPINWHHPVLPARLQVASFVDRDTGYAQVSDVDPLGAPRHWVLRTHDAGQSWAATQLPLTNQPLLRPGLAFATARQGVLVADQGVILRTRDGGQTWQSVPSGTTQHLRSITWRNAQHGVIGGDSATLLTTTNGGQSWQPIRLDSLYYTIYGQTQVGQIFPPGGGIGQVQFVSASNWFTRNLYTLDGGHVWRAGRYTNPGEILESGEVDATDQGWRPNYRLGGSLANFWRSSDGGRTWQKVAELASGVPNYLNGWLTMADAYNAWTMGVWGQMMRYSEKYIQTDTSAAQARRYCAGDTVTVAFDTVGAFTAGERRFRVELSNTMGRFRPGETSLLPLVTGSGSASPLRAVVPANIAGGLRYRLRVIRADSSVLGGDNGYDLTIWPRPAAVAVTPADSARVCAGDSVQLTAPAGYGQYQWSTGATTASIWAKTARSYTVQVAAGGGCYGPASAPVVVRLTPRPVTPTITATPQASGIVILTSSAATGNQWFYNGGPLAGATGPTYAVTTGAQSGTYTVQVTQRGCTSPSSAPQAVTVLGVAGDLKPAELTLTPNPATGEVRLASTGSPVAVTLLDLTGRVVRRLGLDGQSQSEVRLSLEGVPAGAYLVQVRLTDERVLTRRLVVQR